MTMTGDKLSYVTAWRPAPFAFSHCGIDASRRQAHGILREDRRGADSCCSGGWLGHLDFTTAKKKRVEMRRMTERGHDVAMSAGRPKSWYLNSAKSRSKTSRPASV